MEKATEQQAVAITSVFWDIKTFPVPTDSDARLVGPCIKRHLKKFGYSSGSLTIVAVGLLTDVHDDILRALSSTGITLNYVPWGSMGILGTIHDWIDSYPPPANIMLISSNPSIFLKLQKISEYNVCQLFHYDSPFPDSLWKEFLLEDAPMEDDKGSGTDESAYWLCSLCYTYLCQGFENFTTHLSSHEHVKKATQLDVEAVAETFVLWDINSCPVPPACDALRVAPCIKQYLQDLTHSGPLTIVAIGQLTDVSNDILGAVSSTGIVLNNFGFKPQDIFRYMSLWSTFTPTPANLLVICPYSDAFAKVVGRLRRRGYNIIEPFPYYSPYSESRWKSFLLQDLGTLAEDKCSESGEHASWVCSVCNITGKGFEDFTTHISGLEHEQKSTQQMDEEALTVTSVLWDIKSCPVPPGCDARRVAPFIKHYLEDAGYSGPLTIDAIGQLTDVSYDVLQAVSSTGIVLNNFGFKSGAIINYMYLWSTFTPPPANLLVISPYSEAFAKAVGQLQKQGFNIIDLFSYNSPYSESSWKSFLLQDLGTLEEDKFSESGERASWVCSVCDITGKGFEDFTTHISWHEYEQKSAEEEAVAVTSVFWDIKGFPVPPDCDGRVVGPFIKNYLEDGGYSGPLTINACGLLTDIPENVLRAVSSTGIGLNHVAFNSEDIMHIINPWIKLNQPPANMMFICTYSEALAKVVADLQELGYNIIEQPNISLNFNSLWTSCLPEDSGTLEHNNANWFCAVCDIPGKGFENFATHLRQEHA